MGTLYFLLSLICLSAFKGDYQPLVADATITEFRTVSIPIASGSISGGGKAIFDNEVISANLAFQSATSVQDGYVSTGFNIKSLNISGKEVSFNLTVGSSYTSIQLLVIATCDEGE